MADTMADAFAAACAATGADPGDERVRAAWMLAQAEKLRADAWALLIRADLAQQATQAGQAVDEATRARQQAEAAHARQQAAQDRAEAELRECTRRAASVLAATTQGAGLDARVSARALTAALAEEGEALAARVAGHQAATAEAARAVGAARDTEDRARAEAGALLTAAVDPLAGHPAAAATPGYALMMRARWGEIILGDPGHRDYARARAWLYLALRHSGEGAHIEGNAIEGRDRETNAGPVTALPDGTLVTLTGQASAGALRGARGIPPVDDTPGERVAAALREDAGGWQRTPGLPGMGA